MSWIVRRFLTAARRYLRGPAPPDTVPAPVVMNFTDAGGITGSVPVHEPRTWAEYWEEDVADTGPGGITWVSLGQLEWQAAAGSLYGPSHADRNALLQWADDGGQTP